MVRVLDFGSSGLSSRPGWDQSFVFFSKTPALTVPFSTQKYKWALANLMLGIMLQWTGMPSRVE